MGSKKRKNQVGRKQDVPAGAKILLERLRKIRIKKGLSVNKTARRQGFEPSNYTLLEQGKAEPRLSTFLRMLEALEVTWEYVGRFKG